MPPIVTSGCGEQEKPGRCEAAAVSTPPQVLSLGVGSGAASAGAWPL